MKRLTLIAVATATAFLGMIGLMAGAAEATGPASYETDWTSAMNQTSYWSPWQCTKYENHNGQIAAQYDAAIIKDGTKVRVYPDLTQTGSFTAQGATNPANGKTFPAPHSWVMKCKFPPPPPPTTTAPPETTVPPTTLPPETTVPPTTAPPTTEPPTTEPPVTTTPEVTTTTAPPVVETSTPPTLPPAPTTPPPPPPTPTPTELPETGAETWIMALLGGLALTAGTGLVRMARRG